MSSCTWPKIHRSIVFEHPNFINYFTHATPEAELGNLNIGSRPARRKKGVSVHNLRAIPWIFAWTQTRLILPSWLGVGEALSKAIAEVSNRHSQQPAAKVHYLLCAQLGSPEQCFVRPKLGVCCPAMTPFTLSTK